MRVRFLRQIAALVALAGVALLASVDVWAADDFVMIRNVRNPATVITALQAKEMAIGKRKVWPQGAVVLLVLTPVGTPALGWFASRVCGVEEGALMRKIKQEVFKGELRKPVFAASDREVFAAVAAEEGALGIVRTDLAKNLPPGVALLSLR
jgi:hypothetical protein